MTSRGQPSFEVHRLTQISRASRCRRERFCQGGNRFRKVVLAVWRLRLATLMASVGCTTGSAKAATCPERSSCTQSTKSGVIAFRCHCHRETVCSPLHPNCADKPREYFLTGRCNNCTDCQGHDLHNLRETARSPLTVTVRREF